MTHGLLLTNLGTPNSPHIKDVRRYLREFLMDKRVIDLPIALRTLLVHGLIVPFRSKQTAKAYHKIWTAQGSPLLVYSQHLAEQLQQEMGPNYKVVLGMRYGTPSLTQALLTLSDCESITVLPLYPQYSSAATGSSIEKISQILMQQPVIPSLTIINNFYKHPAYISALAPLIQRSLKEDHYLLFSYHGLPERQLQKSTCPKVCAGACPPISNQNQGCYKAQCHQTTELLASALDLKTEQYSTSFQSRLGKTPWIKPYTEAVLQELISKGIKNLSVVCPSFVSDCLETLEEIDLRIREQWFVLGGEQFNLIPCLNTDPLWVKALVQIAQDPFKS